MFFRDDSATGRREQLAGVVEAVRISAIARSAQQIGDVQAALDALPQ